MRWHNLEDQYFEWLDENCECTSERECICKTFNQWIDERIEFMFGDEEEENERSG
jgi:hypothetical protein